MQLQSILALALATLVCAAPIPKPIIEARGLPSLPVGSTQSFGDAVPGAVSTIEGVATKSGINGLKVRAAVSA